MKDRHLTSSLKEAPFSQYRVGDLEVEEVLEVAAELHRLDTGEKLVEGIAEAESRYRKLLEFGGQISIAMAVPAIGPLRLEAMAVDLDPGNPRSKPRVRTDPAAPRDLALYLASRLDTSMAPGSLRRQPTIRELGDDPARLFQKSPNNGTYPLTTSNLFGTIEVCRVSSLSNSLINAFLTMVPASRK